MTPLEISILLHYATRADDFREGDFSAPAVREAIDRFRKVDELLEPTSHHPSAGAAYVITPRGLAYVDALERMPLPVQVWVMPTDPIAAGRTSNS